MENSRHPLFLMPEDYLEFHQYPAAIFEAEISLFKAEGLVLKMRDQLDSIETENRTSLYQLSKAELEQRRDEKDLKTAHLTRLNNEFSVAQRLIEARTAMLSQR